MEVPPTCSAEGTEIEKKEERLVFGLFACCALTCKNKLPNRQTGARLRFHRFPIDEERCKEWLRRARRCDLIDKPVRYVRAKVSLCETHFEPHSYKSAGHLRSDALPTIFDHSWISPEVYPDETVQNDGQKETFSDYPYYVDKEVTSYEVEYNVGSEKKRVEVSGALLDTLHFLGFIGNRRKNGTENYDSVSQENEMINIGTLKKTANSNNRKLLSWNTPNTSEKIVKIIPTDSSNEKGSESLASENGNCTEYEDTYSVYYPRLKSLYSWEKIPEEICRLCTRTNELHPKQSVVKWLELINEIIPEKVQLSDGLPQFICRPCANKVYMCNKLKREFLEADERLENVGFIRSPGVDIETVVSQISEMEKLAELFEEANNAPIPESEPTEEHLDKNRFEDFIGTLDPTEVAVNIEEADFTENNDSASEMVTLDPLGVALDIEEAGFTENNDIASEMVTNTQNYGGLGIRKRPLKYSCSECTESFTSKRDFKAHQAEHRPKGPVELVCQYCSKKFTNRYHLDNHLRCHTDEKPFVCEQCGQGFRIHTSLKNHLLCHIDPTYECPSCDKLFHTKAKLNVHKLTHGGGNHMCDICGKILLFKESLKAHLLKHDDTVAHKCTECSKSYRLPAELRRHKKLNHSGQIFKCDVCNKTLSTAKSLTAHMNCHTTIPVCRCPICLRPFHNYANRARHLRFTCKSIFCVVCKETFESISVLQEHRGKEHSAQEIAEAGEAHLELELVCEICFVSVRGLNKMSEHLQAAHNISDVYACERCLKCFVTERRLFQHLQICKKWAKYPARKTRASVLQCKVCFETIIGETNMLKHVKLFHEGCKPYDCEICGKSYPSRLYLKLHYQRHSTERPYSCFTCHQKFKTKASQWWHMNTHHQDTFPHPCPHCNRRFRLESSLILHIKRHKDRAYNCPFCGSTFATKGDLKKHTDIHFGIERKTRKKRKDSKVKPNESDLQQTTEVEFYTVELS